MLHFDESAGNCPGHLRGGGKVRTGFLISKAVLYLPQEKPEEQQEHCALPQNVVLFFLGTNTKNSGTSQLSSHSSVFYLKMRISVQIGRVA